MTDLKIGDIAVYIGNEGSTIGNLTKNNKGKRVKILKISHRSGYLVAGLVSILGNAAIWVDKDSLRPLTKVEKALK